MTKYGSYLVCNEHINEVRSFLKQFFKEKSDGYSFEDWVSFEIPGSDFLINLMRGGDQAITKNMTFEVYCESLAELESLAQKHDAKIESFVSTSSPQHYKYHYFELFGPCDICKVEVNFTENL